MSFEITKIGYHNQTFTQNDRCQLTNYTFAQLVDSHFQQERDYSQAYELLKQVTSDKTQVFVQTVLPIVQEYLGPVLPYFAAIVGYNFISSNPVHHLVDLKALRTQLQDPNNRTSYDRVVLYGIDQLRGAKSYARFNSFPHIQVHQDMPMVDFLRVSQITSVEECSVVSSFRNLELILLSDEELANWISLIFKFPSIMKSLNWPKLIALWANRPQSELNKTRAGTKDLISTLEQLLDFDVAEKGKIHFELGKIYHYHLNFECISDFPKAAWHYEQAFLLDPSLKSVKNILTLSQIYRDLSQFEKAIALLQLAIEHAKQNKLADIYLLYVDLGETYLKDGRHIEALEILHLATELAWPYGFDDAHLLLGETYKLLGDYGTAIEHLGKVRKGRFPIYYARVYQLEIAIIVGRFVEAREQLNQLNQEVYDNKWRETLHLVRLIRQQERALAISENFANQLNS